MSRWQRGQATIEQMLADGELKPVTGAAANGEPWLAKARRTLATAGGDRGVSGSIGVRLYPLGLGYVWAECCSDIPCGAGHHAARVLTLVCGEATEAIYQFLFLDVDVNRRLCPESLIPSRLGCVMSVRRTPNRSAEDHAL